MQRALLTVDLGFGDAGKGSIVDFLTRHYAAHTVIRYSGGAQAGHRVVTADQREHVFAQFGSGTLAGAATHLTQYMLVEPLAMLAEERHLRTIGVGDCFERTTIDERAPVVTPFHRAVNRLRELARGAERHGSCGIGIGETMADLLAYGSQVLRVGDLRRPDVLRTKLHFLRRINRAKVEALQPMLGTTEQARDEIDLLADDDWLMDLVQAYGEFAQRAKIVPSTYVSALLAQPGNVVFEAAQGVLLDEWQGFHPHTTWSTTTLANADAILGAAGYEGRTTRIGITRAYATRHGAGPLVTEDAALTQALPDAANTFGLWQAGFRVGWLDLVLLRYAVEVTGDLDYLAVTCLDRLDELPERQICRRYLYDTFIVDRIAHGAAPRSLDYQAEIGGKLDRCRPVLEAVAMADDICPILEETLGVPVQLLSRGATANDKEWRERYPAVFQAEPVRMTTE